MENVNQPYIVERNVQNHRNSYTTFEVLKQKMSLVFYNLSRWKSLQCSEGGVGYARRPGGLPYKNDRSARWKF